MFHVPAHKNVKNPAGQVLLGGGGRRLGDCGHAEFAFYSPDTYRNEALGAPDFELDHYGEDFTLRAISAAAESWVDNNLSMTQALYGHALKIHPAYVAGIVANIIACGLRIS
jgi:hypothetical protein